MFVKIVDTIPVLAFLHDQKWLFRKAGFYPTNQMFLKSPNWLESRPSKKPTFALCKPAIYVFCRGI